jgi:hypothetical protein
MKFIHFGCWNNGLCATGQDNGLTKMTKLLNEYVSQPENKDNIKFITVAGDNYYPSKIEKKYNGKDEKIKIFDNQHFESGFECLPKNIKKYILFGNHEIEDVVIDNQRTEYNKDSTYEELEPLQEQCKSLILQTTNKSNIFKNDPNYEFFNDVIVQTYKKTLIIMLDTTIYTFKEKKRVYEKKINETCYQHLFNNVDRNYTIRELMIYQETKIREAIDANKECKNIIFIGHHPFAHMVNKYRIIKGKKERLNIFEHNSKMVKFFNNIYEILKSKKIYYLCADTHLYQQSTFTINPSASNEIIIHQYIVGTGGADQDELPVYDDKKDKKKPENHTTIDGIKISYDIIYNKKTFGFITVNIQDDDIIDIKYHDTEPKLEETKSEDLSGGYLKKYLKYKAKYLQIKQIKQNL